jgi:hypothetical protein
MATAGANEEIPKEWNLPEMVQVLRPILRCVSCRVEQRVCGRLRDAHTCLGTSRSLPSRAGRF